MVRMQMGDEDSAKFSLQYSGHFELIHCAVPRVNQVGIAVDYDGGGDSMTTLLDDRTTCRSENNGAGSLLVERDRVGTPIFGSAGVGLALNEPGRGGRCCCGTDSTGADFEHIASGGL